jgi:hypothetical protein
MDKFIYWFNRNYTQITWFLIGWLVQAAMIQFSRGDYIGALFDLGLAYFNYALYTRRM